MDSQEHTTLQSAYRWVVVTLRIWWIRVRAWVLTLVQGVSVAVFLVSAWAAVYRRALPAPLVGPRYDAAGIPSPFRIIPGLSQSPFVDLQALTWLILALVALVVSWRLTAT